MPVVLMAQGCREVDVGGDRRYAGMHGRASEYAQGGIFRDVPDDQARLMAAAGGYIVPPGGPARTGGGLRCLGCGRLNYFSPCGRCGSEEHEPE
jgi:hypothetical protein